MLLSALMGVVASAGRARYPDEVIQFSGGDTGIGGEEVPRPNIILPPRTPPVIILPPPEDDTVVLP